MGPGTVIASGVTVGNRVSFYANACTMPWIKIGDECSISCATGVKEDLAPGTKL